ncbi:hypothetical protein BC629DRAFT_1539453 [Irpex lacteus]|nr:hypothetical protein BC629DRAFT_1539453 [Irpex lacteus]
MHTTEEFVKTRDVSCMRTYDVSDNGDKEELQRALSMNPVWDAFVFKKYAWEVFGHPHNMWRAVSFVRPCASVPAEDNDTLRSFASFPPVTKFSLLWGGPVWIEPYNHDGVTVADVLQQILDTDKSLSMHNSDFGELIERFEPGGLWEGKTHRMVPRSWTLSDTFKALGGLLDWLTIVRWTGLNIEEIYRDGIACYMQFQLQKLPDKYEDFIKLTTLRR